MSITSDLKSYVDQTVASAQAQLNDVAGTANDYVGKYRENVGDIAEKANEAIDDLRSTAEKAINLDAIKTAVEPYLSQVREYGNVVTDRAEGIYNGVKDDPRLAKFVETANAVSTVVLEQVNEYVVKPVASITGLGAKPAARTAPKPAQAATTKPATAKPATTKPASKPTTGRPSATATAKAAAAKPAAVKAKVTSTAKPAARKATARKS